MLSFDPMVVIAATSYFFGIYLHYIHIFTIFHLVDKYEELVFWKVVLHSLIWPVTVLHFWYVSVFDDEDEEEE